MRARHTTLPRVHISFVAILLILGVVLGVAPFAAPAAAATPSFRQAAAKEITSGAANILAFTSANVAGGLIVVSVVWNNTNTVTITDSRGNMYAPATARITWNGIWSAQMFYAKNIAAGANTVTATFATAINSFGIMQLHEYSGIDTVSPFDGATAAPGTGTSMNSGSITTTRANDLIFGAGASIGEMGAIGAGFTQRLNTAGNKTMDKIGATATSYNATATHGGGPWVMQVAAFKADAADTTPPSVPAGFAANPLSSTQINLSWSASTDDVGVTGYQIERCQGPGCSNFSLLTTVAGTTYSNSGLAPSTTYRYRLRAADAAGNLSGYTSIATATTPGAPDTIPPSTPTGLNGTGLSVSQVSLGWNAATDNVAVTGYKIFRNGVQVGSATGTSFSDTGLTVNTTYSYAVSAFDAANNNSAQSAAVNVSTLPDTAPPTVPTSLAAQVISPTQITLSWSASADNVGVVGYRIYRDTTLIATSPVSPWQNSGLQPGTTYAYAIRAFDAAGNESALTAPVTATTPAPDTQPPTASMTAPANGATVSGTIVVSASAADNVGVADVEFMLDGVSIGLDSISPYSVQWNTTTAANGLHALSARARDTAGNFGVTSGVVQVTVNNSAPPIPAGLIAAWAFNEGSGTTSADLSGGGNTVTLVNGPTWIAGKYGTGVRLDKINDYLRALNSPTLNVTGSALTMSAWVFPLAGGGDQVLFGKFWNANMTSPVYQYAIELQNGGVRPLFFVGTSGGLRSVSMGSDLPSGQWSHLAVTFDGLLARFYVNGNLVASPSLSASLTARDTPLHVGADANLSQLFNGMVDEFRIYRRTLSQSEIQTDMNTPLNSGSDPTAPTVTITSPTNNAQVGGIITITADADDETGVLGVQFFVDGTATGPEDTVEPYGANWDTRGVANGAHTLTARARDTSGNTAVSAPVNANVANSDFFQNEVLATGFDLPTAMKFLPDGRMLVAELRGKVKIVPPPYTSPGATPLLQITNLGNVSQIQQGIFDLALDPDFVTNHYFYIFYTAGTPNGDRDRLSRFTANATITGTIAGSELVLYQDPANAADEHHGGAINFANDGTILFTTGEHFQPPRAQDLNDPRGKVHRINRDGTVPTNNPFYDGAGPHWDSVWAYGLRNPFRAFYDAPTGRLYIGDVGGNVGSSNEEINLGVAGANYGWPTSEGPCAPPCTSPLYDYEHNNRDASITGGFIYRGTQFPSSMQGNYFFADYAQNWIRRLTFDSNGNVSGVFNFEPADGTPDGPTGDVVYLTQGPDGALYYIDLGYSDTTGTFGVSKVRRIRYVQSNQAPTSVIAANPTSGPQPLTVTFSSAGSTDPEGQPLTYSWDFGDGTLSNQANPTHVYTQPGRYTVRLTVSDGPNTTFSTPLTISVGNKPVATITAPTDGLTFRAGDVITYTGNATDLEDGTLPATAFSWTVDFLHDGHVHPGAVVSGTKTGSFTIPTSGHDFHGNTRYRINLTVTDSHGLQDTKSVTVWPQKVDLSFTTVPAGLTIFLDDQPKITPLTYDTLVGFNHVVDARNQTGGSTNYTFSSWSDGGAQSHTIVAGTAPQTFTATFTATQAPNGLMAAWGFNEGSGSTAADTSGNGNVATLVNGPTWTTGRYGGGLSFDHTNDYLTLPNSSSLNVSGSALTLSVWLRPTSMPGDSVVLAKLWNAGWTPPYYQYGIELQSNGSRPVFFVGTSTGYLSSAMDTTLPYGQWSHLAITFNGSQVLFYVNGTLVSTKTLSATMTARGQQMRVAADARPSQFYFGTLDDLRIYNRVQTSAEVLSDMNTGL